MAGDAVNSNIFVNIDTTQAMAQLRALEKELTALNRSLITGTKAASVAQSKFAQSLLHNVNATGQWSAAMTRMTTATDQFANRLEKSKLSLKEYYRYGMASTRSFGRFFRNEYDTLGKLAEKRVKTLQQQYVQLGRDATGAMQAMRFTPKTLNYSDVGTRMMLAIQRQQMLNKLIDDGSTKLLNFGKNTQWAGRQLMVGFTVPLMLFGAQAIRTFKEIETQTLRFKKVYGDLFTNSDETEKALENINKLAKEYTKYGLKVADTIKTAADAAAAGNTGENLQRIVDQTNKLAVLGGVTQEKALETTIALQNAFKIQGTELNQTIDFLNAVENQTVVALEDLTEAIPRVAPVIQQLGGDVKDLAYFLAAMQEGGISAAQGANALKSGLASLINPTKAAKEMAADFGIGLEALVKDNMGNVRGMVQQLAMSLDSLSAGDRTRLIEKIFGKYQFARISALLNNVTTQGTQAARVLDLTNRSVEELALLSQREMKTQENSAMNQLAAAIEQLKVAIAPIGQLFAETLTPAIKFIGKFAEKFNNLPEGFKKAFAIIVGVVGALGPIFLMTFGLIANAFANGLKGVNLLRKGYQQLAYGSSDAAFKTQFLTQEELENIAVTNSLYAKHEQLSAAYRLEQSALASLALEYQRASVAMRNFSASNPGMFLPPGARGRFGGTPPQRFSDGTGSVPGPKGAGDVVPAMLSPGEAVIPADQAQKYSGFISAMIKDKIPGHFRGLNPFARNPFMKTGFADELVFGAASGVAKRSGGVYSASAVAGRDDLLKITVGSGADDGQDVSFLIRKAEKDKLDNILLENEKYYSANEKRSKRLGKIKRGESGILHSDSPEGKLYYAIKRKGFAGKVIDDLAKDIGSRMPVGNSSRTIPLPSHITRKKHKIAKAMPQEVRDEFANELVSLRDAIRRGDITDLDEASLYGILKIKPKDDSGFDNIVANLRSGQKGYASSHIVPRSQLAKEGKNEWAEDNLIMDSNIVNESLKNTFHAPITKQSAETVLASLIKEAQVSELSPKQKILGWILQDRIKRGFYDNPNNLKTFAHYEDGVFSVPGPKGAGDIVPAMLSPGEAVIPADQAEKNRGLISAMIAGKVPGAIEGWDDADENTKPGKKGGVRDSLKWASPKNIAAAARGGFLAEQVGAAVKNVGGAVGRATATGAKKAGKAALAAADRKYQNFMEDNTKELKNNTAATADGTEKQQITTKQQEKLAKQEKKMNWTQKSMMPSMALGMALPMIAMQQQAKNPEGFIGRNADAIMYGGIAASVLIPMLNTPGRRVAGGLLALAGAVYAYEKSIRNAILEAAKFGDSLHNTVAVLESFGAVTGRMSATQVQLEKRRNRMTGLEPYDLSFGQDFIKGEAGQNFRKEFLKSTEGVSRGSAKQILSSRLAQAVTQNVLSYEQAQSIGVAIARSLGDEGMELEVLANLRGIMGPNGEDLIKDPLKVQMELIANNKTINDQFFNSLNAEAKKQYAGFLNMNGQEWKQAGVVGVGAATAGGLYGLKRYVQGGKGAGNIGRAKGAYHSALAARGALPIVSSIKAKGLARGGTQAVSVGSKALMGARAASLAATGTGIGAAVGIPALIATALAEIGLRYYQKGQERKEVGKVAGALTGSATGTVRDVTMGIDAIREITDLKISQLEKELAMTKEAEKRKQIEKEILDLKTQSDKDVNQLVGQRKAAIDQAMQYRDSIKDDKARELFDKSIELSSKDRRKKLEGYQRTEADNLQLYLQTPEFRDAKVTAPKEQIRKAKEELEAARKAALEPGISDIEAQKRNEQVIAKRNELIKLENQKFDPGRLQTQIDIMLNAGLVTDADVMTLLSVAKETKENPQYYIDLIASVEDPAGVMNILDGLDNVKSKEIVLNIVDKTKGTEEGKNIIDALTEFKKAKAGLDQEYGQDLGVDLDQVVKRGTGNANDILFGKNGIVNEQNLEGSRKALKRTSKELGFMKAQINEKEFSSKNAKDQKTMLQGLAKQYQETFGVANQTLEQVIANWEKIGGLDSEVRLQAVMTTSVIESTQSQNEIAKAVRNAFIQEKGGSKYLSSMPSDFISYEYEQWARDPKNKAKIQKIAENAKNAQYDVLFGPDGALNPNAYKSEDPKDTGPKLNMDWLNDLLQKLKLVKESSIDSTGSYTDLIKELNVWLGTTNKLNPSLDKQKGALSAIRREAAKTGTVLSTEFMTILESMDPEQFEMWTKKLFDLGKEGRITELSKAFLTINEAFNTAVIGKYIDDLEEAVRQTEVQVKAFDVLENAGFKAADAMRLVSDEALAAAVASKKMTKEELNLLKQITETSQKLADKFKVVGDFKVKMEQIGQQSAAYMKLRQAGIAAAQAAELSNSPETARAIVYLAAEGGEAWANATVQIRKYAEEQKALSKLLLAGSEAGDYEVTRIEMAKKFINLQEKLIEMQHRKEKRNLEEKIMLQEEVGRQLQNQIDKITKTEIRPKEDILTLNQYELEEISYKEDQINETYDERIESLERIYSINAKTAELEKAKLNVAEALSRGDIAAAASAIQQVREQERQNAQDAARENLENQRESLIDSLGRKKIEKENAKIQLEISRIQRDRLDTLERSKEIVDEEIDANNRKLEQLDMLIQKQKESISFFGLSSTELDDALSILQMAKEAGIDINDKAILDTFIKAFKEGTTDAENLKKLISTLVPESALKSFAELAALREKVGQPPSQLPVTDKDGLPEPFSMIKLAWEKIQGEAKKYADWISNLVKEKIDSASISQYADAWTFDAKKKMSDYLTDIKDKIKAGTISPSDIETYAQAWVDGKLPGGKAGALQYLQEYLTKVSEDLKDPTYIDEGKKLIESLAETWKLPKDEAGNYYTFTKEEQALLSLLFESEIQPGDIAAGAWERALAAAKAYFDYLRSQGTGGTGGTGGNGGSGGSPEQALKEATEAAEDAAKAEKESADALAEAEAAAKEAADALAEVDAILTEMETVIDEMDEANDAMAAEIYKKLQKSGSRAEAENFINNYLGGQVGGGGPLQQRFLSRGGLVKPKYFAVGGMARGSDKIPAMLSPGEFIMSRYAVENYGLEKMKAINNGDSVGDSVYNYSIAVNVKSDANPDEIARAVMTQIKQVDSKKLRGNRI
jgi:TP901 family phage tail tape measure protein